MENQFRKLSTNELIICYNQFLELEKVKFPPEDSLFNKIRKLYIEEYNTLSSVAFTVDLLRACCERWIKEKNKTKK